MPILGIIASGKTASTISTTAYQSIQTYTVGSGGATDITFSSIPATYTHLQIRGIVRTSAVAEIRMQFNGDTASNYSWHEMASTGTARNANNGTSSPRISIAYWNGFPSTASTFGPLVLDILDYTNTNKYKTTRAISGYDANGTGGVTFSSGNWRNTSAITDIKLFNDSTYTFEQYSQFALYGIKGA